MKRIFWIFIVLCSLVGCTRSEIQGVGDSYVTLSAVADPSLNIKQVKASGHTIPLPDDYSYTVRHATGDKSVVAQGGSIASLGTLALMAGNYVFEVASVGEASLEAPTYAGSATFSVQKGATTAVEVQARLASSVVEVHFSDAVKSGFTSYKATISAKGVAQTAVFDGSTPDGRLIYLPAPASQVSCMIEVTSKQELYFTTTQTVESLAAADLLSWRIDIPAYEEKPSEPFVLELVLDQKLNEEERNFTFSLNPLATGSPTILGADIELSLPIAVKLGLGIEAHLNLRTPAKLEKVLLLFDLLQKPITDCPQQAVVDVLALSEQERVQWGVSIDEGGLGQEKMVLDLSALTKKMPGTPNAAEAFFLTIGLLDQNANYVTRKLEFNVYDVSLLTLDYLNAGAIDWFGHYGPINLVNVRLQGKYNVDDVPDGLAFQYRRQGEASWQVAEPTINTTTKAVYVDLPLLPDGGLWEYRLSSGDENGAVVQLPTLPTYPVYSNLSLDAWGGGTRANPDNWSSPNFDGVFGAGVVNATSRQTGRTGAGYAARIVSSDAAGQFASGGLFTGSMKVDMNNPYKSAKVGNPFSGRPKKLVGYFKYKANNIHRLDVSTLPGNGAKSGEPDMCEIAVKFELWNGGNYSIRWRDGFFGNPGSAYLNSEGVPVEARVAQVVNYDGNGSGPLDVRKTISVGYGKIASRGQADWSRFEIDIEYFQDKIPDRMIITAVSSAWGGYMSGAEGSELWVDDLEFVY